MLRLNNMQFSTPEAAFSAGNTPYCSARILFLLLRIATLPGRGSRGRRSKPTATAHFNFWVTA